eukprot:m.245861 g.245861  ORF g.245861 m.245861 type:complete len:338 (-) comp19055_c1_seq1:23-1036(-)
MLVILSPAKTLCLDAHRLAMSLAGTVPRFSSEAEFLASAAGQLSKGQLRTVLGVSEPLAQLNHDRYKHWSTASTLHTALMLRGDAYRALQAYDMTKPQLELLQGSVRILSGIYGLLKPLDLIKPYRMDMGKKLSSERGKDLYEFWGDKLSDALQEELDAQPAGQRFLVNCASQEYSKAARLDNLNVPVYLMKFPGPSVFAKGARGAMARFAALNKITSPEQLKDFKGNDGEWSFCAKQSSKFEFVFLRSAEVAAAAKAKQQGSVATKRKKAAPTTKKAGSKKRKPSGEATDNNKDKVAASETAEGGNNSTRGVAARSRTRSETAKTTTKKPAKRARR